MSIKSKECFNFLQSLESKKFTDKAVLLPPEIAGEYNILDFWKRKGKKITIISDFVNALDMSYGRWDMIILVGNFVRADLTKCRISYLDVSRANIVKLDLTECKIGEFIVASANIKELDKTDAKIEDEYAHSKI